MSFHLTLGRLSRTSPSMTSRSRSSSLFPRALPVAAAEAGADPAHHSDDCMHAQKQDSARPFIYLLSQHAHDMRMHRRWGCDMPLLWS